jgi:hypothetical protein
MEHLLWMIDVLFLMVSEVRCAQWWLMNTNTPLLTSAPPRCSGLRREIELGLRELRPSGGEHNRNS